MGEGCDSAPPHKDHKRPGREGGSQKGRRGLACVQECAAGSRQTHRYWGRGGNARRQDGAHTCVRKCAAGSREKPPTRVALLHPSKITKH